jgi:glycosyltransferase involved in cell wall biosynthesis
MRIVAHNGARIWGGAERATVSLLEGLRDRGHGVLLLCNDALVAREASARGIASRVCVVGGDPMVPHAIRLARELRKETPDVFIVGTYKKLFLAALGARLARVPRIVARVGLESDTPRSAKYRFALRHWTDGVAVNSQRMRKSFADLDGFGAEKVTVIWNSVRPPSNDPRSDAIRRELGIADDAFVIGTVARLAKQKRLDRLIRAASLLPRVTVVIAGEGSARTSLENLAAELGISNRVRLLGHRDDVRNVMDALDVFVLTSDSEGMSNAMLEAMSRGLPIVTTDVSGARDAIPESENHAAAGIVTGFDVESIASAISSLQRDAGLRESMGNAARRRIATQFARDSMLDAWEDFLSPQPGR